MLTISTIVITIIITIISTITSTITIAIVIAIAIDVDIAIAIAFASIAITITVNWNKKMGGFQWSMAKQLGIGPGCGITLQKMSARGRPRPINNKLINCAILRFLVFFLSLKTYPSWVSIKTLSCGQSYSCIPIIVICILYFVFYNI